MPICKPKTKLTVNIIVSNNTTNSKLYPYPKNLNIVQEIEKKYFGDDTGNYFIVNDYITSKHIRQLYL